jgi:hypothetical protein
MAKANFRHIDKYLTGDSGFGSGSSDQKQEIYAKWQHSKDAYRLMEKYFISELH